MTSAPARSPSHQVIHVVARAVGAPPEKTRLAMPTVALIIVLETQTSANLATPVVVANVARPSHQSIDQPCSHERFERVAKSDSRRRVD